MARALFLQATDFSERIQLFECSTLLGFATVMAIVRKLKKTGEFADKTILLLSVNSRHPEVENPFRESPRMLEIAEETFSQIVFLNDLIFPVHPSSWDIGRDWAADQSMWLRQLGVDHIDEIFLESIQVTPSLTLARIFGAARIHAYSDGMMVYSPTRRSLPRGVLSRIRTVSYVEFLPGVVPLLHEEAQPDYEQIAPDELRPIFAELAGFSDSEGRASELDELFASDNTAIFLGQAMANAQMISIDREIEIYVDGLVRLDECGSIEHVLFKPHPSATAASTRRVAAAFVKRTGKDLRLLPARIPLESILLKRDVRALAGVFSTALFTAARLFEVPAFSFGAMEVMQNLEPFSNSNRIPLLAAEVCLLHLEDIESALAHDGEDQGGRAPGLERRLRRFRALQVAVGFHMQPKILESRSAEVREGLSSQLEEAMPFLLGAPDPLFLWSEPEIQPRTTVAGEIVYWTARQLMDERKAQKLRRRPDRFFADSKNPLMRVFGRFFGRAAE